MKLFSDKVTASRLCEACAISDIIAGRGRHTLTNYSQKRHQFTNSWMHARFWMVRTRFPSKNFCWSKKNSGSLSLYTTKGRAGFQFIRKSKQKQIYPLVRHWRELYRRQWGQQQLILCWYYKAVCELYHVGRFFGNKVWKVEETVFL